MLGECSGKQHVHLDPHRRYSATADHCQKLVTGLDRTLVWPSMMLPVFATIHSSHSIMPFLFSQDFNFILLVWRANAQEPSPSSLPQRMAQHPNTQSTLLGIKPHFCAPFCSPVCSPKDGASQPRCQVLTLFYPGPACPELTQDLAAAEEPSLGAGGKVPPGREVEDGPREEAFLHQCL